MGTASLKALKYHHILAPAAIQSMKTATAQATVAHLAPIQSAASHQAVLHQAALHQAASH